MVALLALTVFDIGEFWFLSNKTESSNTTTNTNTGTNTGTNTNTGTGTGPLYIVAALHRDKSLQPWTIEGKSVRLRRGEDMAGHVLRSASPYVNMGIWEYVWVILCLGGYCYMLLASYVMWSGVLESPDFLLSHSAIPYKHT